MFPPKKKKLKPRKLEFIDHGLTLNLYEESNQKVSDFIELFNVRSGFLLKKGMKHKELIVGEVVYAKEDFLRRKIYIDGAEFFYDFKPKTVKTK